MKNAVPVTILTGFLGSGKTTLVNRVLKESGGVRFALIINEFGEIGLDAGLITTAQDFVKMDNGCLCCVLNEELEKTIVKLQARADYDAVILETTGIADPLPVAWSFLKPQFASAFRLGGIVTVVDALHLEKMLAQATETQMQIERADYLYLAKTDLCDDARIKEVTKKLNGLNPQARCVSGTDPHAVRLLFDFEKGRTLVQAPPHHDAGHARGFQSVAVSLQGKKLKLDVLEGFFENLPHEVFRAKAVFRDDLGKIIVMHAVCGRVDFDEMSGYKGHLAAVFIGKGMDENRLRSEFSKLIHSQTA